MLHDNGFVYQNDENAEKTNHSHTALSMVMMALTPIISQLVSLCTRQRSWYRHDDVTRLVIYATQHWCLTLCGSLSVLWGFLYWSAPHDSIGPMHAWLFGTAFCRPLALSGKNDPNFHIGITNRTMNCERKVVSKKERKEGRKKSTKRKSEKEGKQKNKTNMSINYEIVSLRYFSLYILTRKSISVCSCRYISNAIDLYSLTSIHSLSHTHIGTHEYSVGHTSTHLCMHIHRQYQTLLIYTHLHSFTHSHTHIGTYKYSVGHTSAHLCMYMHPLFCCDWI